MERGRRVALQRIGLGLVVGTLALESLVALADAAAAVIRPVRATYYMLLAGDPPVFAGLLILAYASGPGRLRRTSLLAFLIFAVACALNLADLLKGKIPALSSVTGPVVDHITSGAEVLGFIVLLAGWGPPVLSAPEERAPRARLWLTAAAVATAARGALGLAPMVRPGPVSAMLVGIGSALMFAASAQVGRLLLRSGAAPAT